MSTVYTVEEKELAKRMYKQFYGLAYPEKVKEWNRKYYLANINKAREKSRKFKLANPEKIKEKDRKYYLANINKIKELTRKYRLANINKIKEKERKYYAKKRYGCNWELALRLIEKKERLRNEIRVDNEFIRSLK